MDAPQGFNPYLGLNQQEKNDKLREAVQWNNTEQAALLIKAGANIEYTTVIFGFPTRPLFHLAVYSGYREMAELLIAHGVDDMEGISPESSENTLLMDAAEQQHLSTVDLLIQMGAQTNRVDTTGNTALVKSAWGRAQSFHFYQPTDVTYRLLCELNADELDAYAKESPKHKEAVERVIKTQDRVRQIIMPFALNIKGANGCKLIPDLLNMISGLVIKLQQEEGSLPIWYTPCAIERNIRKFMDTFIPKKIKDALIAAPTVTPLRDAKDKKRKAEDDLEENGRNKRRRVENQDEQESTYFPFGGDCSLQ